MSGGSTTLVIEMWAYKWMKCGPIANIDSHNLLKSHTGKWTRCGPTVDEMWLYGGRNVALSWMKCGAMCLKPFLDNGFGASIKIY